MNKVRRHIFVFDSCYKLDAAINTGNPNLGRLRSLVDWIMTFEVSLGKVVSYYLKAEPGAGGAHL